MADDPLPELVIEALETALQRDGETPLIKKGKSVGLLPAKSSPERKKAVDICLDEKRGFFKIESATKGKTTTHLAALTSTGIKTLLKLADPQRRSELIEQAAEEHRNTVDTVALELAEDDLNRIADEQQLLSEESKQLSEMMIRLMDTQFDTIRKNQERLQREAEALQAMKRPEHEEIVSTSQPSMENDSRTQLCQDLVNAWQAAETEETRKTLERIMLNNGLEHAETRGDSVQYNADTHVSDDDLLPEQPATVVSPGWRLNSEQGTLSLSKSKVEALRPHELDEGDPPLA